MRDEGWKLNRSLKQKTCFYEWWLVNLWNKIWKEAENIMGSSLVHYMTGLDIFSAVRVVWCFM